MKPFDNESDQLEIGGLTIENRTDRISLYGSLDICLDQTGLAAAMELRELFAKIVAAMESRTLSQTHEVEKPDTTDNPFA